MANTSRPKWHLAHTSWFFETFVLKPYVKDYQVWQAGFEVLFNSYYNGIGHSIRVPSAVCYRDHRCGMCLPTAPM